MARWDNLSGNRRKHTKPKDVHREPVVEHTCPKCDAVSGDDWSQCKGRCPMPMSPHYVGIAVKPATPQRIR